MDIVRNTARAVKSIFDPLTREANHSTMSTKPKRTTPVRAKKIFPRHNQHQPQRCLGSSSDANGHVNNAVPALKRMLYFSRKKAKKQRQAYRQLQKEHKDMSQKCKGLSQSNEQLQQENQELRQKRLHLIHEHDKLRLDHQDLRQESKELRRECRERRERHREYQDLQREHQRLRQEHQELQCIHDEVKQDLVMVELKKKKLEDELKQSNTMSLEGRQILKDNLAHYESRYNYIVRKIAEPYANSKGLPYGDKDSETIDVVLKPLIRDALQAGVLQEQIQDLSAQLQKSRAKVMVLQEQIQGLQKEMLARVEKVHAVSDEQFAQGFRVLTGHVKSLSRSIRLSPDANILEVLASGMLFLNTEQRHWKVRANQKYYIEAWIWNVLLDIVFATPFSVYGNAGSAFGQNWRTVYGHNYEERLPSPSESSESFRCTIADQLVRLAGRETIVQGRSDAYMRDRQFARGLATGASKCRDDVANTIGTKLTNISSTVDVSQISNIVDRAFTLALDMSLQKCRLQLTYPAVGATFQESSMSSIPDLDGDDIDDGIVAFIINPGLTKWGDAHGKMLDQQYDIVPSLVQLERVTLKQEYV